VLELYPFLKTISFLLLKSSPDKNLPKLSVFPNSSFVSASKIVASAALVASAASLSAFKY